MPSNFKQQERQSLIEKGKLWQVYPDGKHDDADVMHEGSKTSCKEYIRRNNLTRDYARGKVRLGKVIWEAN